MRPAPTPNRPSQDPSSGRSPVKVLWLPMTCAPSRNPAAPAGTAITTSAAAISNARQLGANRRGRMPRRVTAAFDEYKNQSILLDLRVTDLRRVLHIGRLFAKSNRRGSIGAPRTGDCPARAYGVTSRENVAPRTLPSPHPTRMWSSPVVVCTTQVSSTVPICVEKQIRLFKVTSS